MLMYMVLNLIVLVKSGVYKVVNGLEKDTGDKLIAYTTYVPTLATTFPANFPVYFIPNGGELSNSQFGFNVIYGTPKNPDTTYPLITDSKNNLNNNPSEYFSPLQSGNTDSLLFPKNYADNFPFESKDNVFNHQEPKSPLITLYDDWSPDQEERSYKNKAHNSPPTNIYRNYYKQNNPTPISYFNNYRSFPQNQHRDSFRKSRQQRVNGYQNFPTKTKTYSSLKFQKLGTKLNRPVGKLHHREAFNARPIRKIYSKPSKELFRPSPPDIYLNSRNLHTDFAADYSNSAPKYSRLGNFTEKIKRHTCTRTNKTDLNEKYPKEIKHCYVCVEDKTGAHYEECTYEEMPLKYYTHYYDKASTPSEISNKHLRVKREVVPPISTNEQSRGKRQNGFYESNRHPYSQQDPNYRFGPEHFVDDEHPSEEAESSYESDDPNEKCWKKKQGDMLCIACENTNTGGTYEQCSYASEPNKNAYEQSVSSEYGTSRLAEDGGRRQYTDAITELPPPPPPLAHPQPYQDAPVPLSYPDRLPTSYHVPHSNGYYPGAPISPPQYTEPYNPPPLYIVPTNAYINNEPGFGNNFGSHQFNARNNYKNPYGNFDDPFSQIFPEISSNPEPLGEYEEESDENEDLSASLDDEEGQFTMNNRHKIPRNLKSESLNKNHDKMELKRAVDEFSNKNRSACKKLIKNKMTCYQCVDDKGSKREDCMYFRPVPTKSKKMSYSKISEFSTPNNGNMAAKKVMNTPSARVANPRGRYKVPHVNSNKGRYPQRPMLKQKVFNDGTRYSRSSDNDENVANPNAENSANSTEIPDQLDNSNIKKEHETVKDETSEEVIDEIAEEIKITEKYNPIPTEPPELNEPINTEGKFSKDTELIFDPLLGISLPKYMLEKSEHEAMFDEILASG